MFNLTSRIFIAGHQGVVGSAIVRLLEARGYSNLIKVSHSDADLRDADATERLFSQFNPDIVILAAAKVGGIGANIADPVSFLVDNLGIQNNVLLACEHFQVSKTVFLGSSCIYPRLASQPMKESSYMQGPLEPTNESYALAKIAGIRLSQALREQYGTNIICAMPCNVYGPGDHFEFERSHVVSALVRRFTEATRDRSESVTLWGSGKARREFLHVDDLAESILFLLERYESAEIINVGSGVDQSIAELAKLAAAAANYTGEIHWDMSKPDGMPRKLLDVTRIQELGWRHTIDIEAGIISVANDFNSRFPALLTD